MRLRQLAIQSLFLVCAAGVALAQQDGPERDLNLVTFNTGMTPFTSGLQPTYTARLSALTQSLRTDEIFTTSDVVCLQELQLQDDLLSAQASLRAAGLPHHYSFYDNLLPRFDNSQPACDPILANAAFACSSSVPQCAAAAAFGGAALYQCVVSYCPTEFARLSPTCLPCLFDWRAVGFNNINISVSLQRCVATRQQRHYVPTYGLSLSSRLPLSNVRYRPVLNGTTQTVVRGSIHATVRKKARSTAEKSSILFFFPMETSVKPGCPEQSRASP